VTRLLTGPGEAFAVELSSAPRRVASAASHRDGGCLQAGLLPRLRGGMRPMEMWAEKYPGYTDLESVRTMTSPLGGP
jgi:hypothetical protein